MALRPRGMRAGTLAPALLLLRVGVEIVVLLLAGTVRGTSGTGVSGCTSSNSTSGHVLERGRRQSLLTGGWRRRVAGIVDAQRELGHEVGVEQIVPTRPHHKSKESADWSSAASSRSASAAAGTSRCGRSKDRRHSPWTKASCSICTRSIVAHIRRHRHRHRHRLDAAADSPPRSKNASKTNARAREREREREREVRAQD